MRVEKDFKEFIELLNAHKVQYLIVGGFAYSLYAIPRYTKDIDIWINPTYKNAEKMMKVLIDFGFVDINLNEKDFTDQENIIQLGIEPVRIDLVLSLEGLDFKKSWINKYETSYGKEKCYFLSKQDLIINKQKTGRNQDLLDVEILKQTDE